MPAGVPVATVGIGASGAKNAVVLAARILGVGDPRHRDLVRRYKDKLVKESEQKAERVRSEWEKSGQSR
jgi:phosphoribosylcarboxyaminoimidazole (NCAIR) mutase